MQLCRKGRKRRADRQCSGGRKWQCMCWPKSFPIWNVNLQYQIGCRVRGRCCCCCCLVCLENWQTSDLFSTVAEPTNSQRTSSPTLCCTTVAAAPIIICVHHHHPSWPRRRWEEEKLLFRPCSPSTNRLFLNVVVTLLHLSLISPLGTPIPRSRYGARSHSEAKLLFCGD